MIVQVNIVLNRTVIDSDVLTTRAVIIFRVKVSWWYYWFLLVSHQINHIWFKLLKHWSEVRKNSEARTTLQYFPVVLYAVEGGSNARVCEYILKCDHSNESHWAVTFLWCCLLILFKVILTFVSVDEILKYHFSPKSYWAVLSCGTAHYAVQDGSNFWVCVWNPSVPLFTLATEQYFPVVLFIMLYKMVLTFESVDGILKCEHSNESYWAVLACGIVYHAVQGGSNFWVCRWNP